MGPKCLSRKIYLIPIMLLAVILVGCSGVDFGDSDFNSWSYRLLSWDEKSDNNYSGNFKPGTYPVDLLFSDFYLALGGEATLGPVISPVSTTEGQTKQFTEAGLMIFDPSVAKSSRFALAPLGLELGVGEGELLGKAYRTGRIINGHLVIAEFLEEYERLGGARFVGRPISEAYYNPEKDRVEQYFENLGFYRLDAESKIRMMPYGAYACDRNCRNQEPSAGIPIRQPILPDPFLKKTFELGLPFVGKPLTGFHFAPDGMYEVIFENLVLVADHETPNEVYVRPIAESIGTHAQNPTYPQNSSLSIFYEIEGGMGYNIPIYFIEYLDLYGGMQVAGEPISEVYSHEAGVYRQCFTNLCLQFNLNLEGEQRLRPIPLGTEYKAVNYESVRNFEASQELDHLDLKVWEKDTFVSSKGLQEIHVALVEDGKPLVNYELVLIVTMPDGSQRRAYFQPSDENGRTSIKLAPIEAPSGTLIAYKVCLFWMDAEPRCAGDNYLIWNSE
jgi:hypothetical protein